jgi:hypothetical protein
MYRVVTKTMVILDRVRRRETDNGPWQPLEETAQSWAQYLRATGRYDSVTVHSNGQSSAAQDHHADGSDEDLFLEAGQ